MGNTTLIFSIVETIMNIKDISKISPRREFLLRHGKLYWHYYYDTYRVSNRRKTYCVCRKRANYSRIHKIGKRNKKTGVIYK